MLQRRAELYRRHYGVTVREIPEREQKAEIGSDFYRGGIVVEEAGSVHPAKLYRGIRRLAEEAGVTICGRARVDRIDRSGLRFRLSTARGSLDADQLIVATNGYAGSVLPFLQRRVIPITPYMTATEPLPADLARAILPTNRNGGDTKRLIYAFRRSPKGDRLIFTGRARGNHVDERAASDVLHRFLSGVWPDLARFRLTHSWKGFIGFTFDLLPHMGDHNGVHYAAGCQGAGVILMTWLGHRLGTKLLGIDSRQSGFDSADFQGSAFYHGTPWFLPALEARYRVQDWFERRT